MSGSMDVAKDQEYEFCINLENACGEILDLRTRMS